MPPFPLRDPYPSYPTCRPHGNSSGNSKALLSCDRLRLVNGPERGSVADSFGQGSVVSVRACIRARHRRRAGGYRSRRRCFTRTPPGRRVSVTRARILGLHERYLPADERTGGGRRALFRHRGPFGGLHRDESRCLTARDRRHHLSGASRRSPDTGRTAGPAPGMARREPHRWPWVGAARRACANDVADPRLWRSPGPFSAAECHANHSWANA
jgi:hypothetical protein